VDVTAGQVVTLQLVEPEAYAASTSGPPSPAFPWLPGRSSDATALRPVPVCADSSRIFSLPSRLYPFRAITPGRYRISAALNPAYHRPNMHPPLPPLRPVAVTVIVHERQAVAYTVTASVLYRTGMTAPHACLVYLLSLPPAGCGGVPVTGYDFHRLPGLVRYGGMGWQTPVLRLTGAWTGRVLRLTRPPVRADEPSREPGPPFACNGRSTAAIATLGTRLTHAHTRIHLIETEPCGPRLWALVAVADASTRGFIRGHFGRRVIVSGWLRPA
jgi:hypothetical protein